MQVGVGSCERNICLGMTPCSAADAQSDTQMVLVGQDRSLAEIHPFRLGSLHGNVHTSKPSEIPVCQYAKLQFILNLIYSTKCVAQKTSGIAAAVQGDISSSYN